MIKKDTLQFLREIEKNNNKPWFEKNKHRYEKAKQDYLDFIKNLLDEIRKIEPIYEKDLKKYASRIYRDLRFSKDKRPYKNSIGSIIERAPQDKKCGYYLHIQPGKSFIGGGIWQPQRTSLDKVRQEIDYNARELTAIINKKSFKTIFGSIQGESLKRPPKGYSEENPNIELLKLKEYLIIHQFSDETVCSKNFIRELSLCYKAGLPFLKYFDVVKEENQQ